MSTSSLHTQFPLFNFFSILDVVSSSFQPCLTRDFEVHDGKEWVVLIFLLNNTIKYIIVSNDLTFLLLLSGHQEYLELSSQFEYEHPLIALHVSVLFSHAPVEELVKVNISRFTVDGHLQKMLFQLAIIVELITKPKTSLLITELSQSSEELSQIFLLDLVASISVLSQLFPYDHEALQVILE